MRLVFSGVLTSAAGGGLLVPGLVGSRRGEAAGSAPVAPAALQKLVGFGSCLDVVLRVLLEVLHADAQSVSP